MERLSGLDAGFLYLETPALLMHTLKLALIDPPEHSVGDVRTRLIAAAKTRLPLLPSLRRRLLEVPLGLHHPLWIETAEVDLERHILRAAIRAPGGAREMDATIAEIAGHPLDRSRPLWELWILEGRADGALAVLLKIHHALADGAAAAHLIAAVTSRDGAAAMPIQPAKLPPPEPVPTGCALFRSAAWDRLQELGALPSLMARTANRAFSLMRQPEKKASLPVPMWDAPRTSFNGSLSARRTIATVSLPLARVLAVKAAANVTLNDVVLGLVGSALRGYLGARGELPARSLIASVPTSGEVEARPRLTGNRVSSLFTTLGTDIADPWERLHTISAVTSQAKHVQSVMGTELLAAWLQYALPGPLSWAVSEWSRRGIANLVPPPVNVVVSNVHGPHERLFAGGLPLRAIYSVGPILEGIGLNVTVWSYVNQLHFMVLACPAMMADAHQITDLLEPGLQELEARAISPPDAMPCAVAS